MLKRSIMLTVASIGLAAAVLSQENGAGVPGVSAIAARQAGMDMSSITFRSMGEAM
jgi:hypothetical protein